VPVVEVGPIILRHDDDAIPYELELRGEVSLGYVAQKVFQSMAAGRIRQEAAPVAFPALELPELGPRVQEQDVPATLHDSMEKPVLLEAISAIKQLQRRIKRIGKRSTSDYRARAALGSMALWPTVRVNTRRNRHIRRRAPHRAQRTLLEEVHVLDALRHVVRIEQAIGLDTKN